MKKYKYYEFFAGAGLVTLGLRKHWDCIWANDIDPKKENTYKTNIESNNYHLSDIEKIQSKDLPIPCDMAWASFPCQDLSLAGWRSGMSGERSGTFWSFWRLIQGLNPPDRPKMIVLENVVGLLYDKDFIGLCEALSCLGMQFGALVIDGIHFVPQSRPRVFVVAVNRDMDCGPFVDPWHFNSPWISGQLEKVQSSLPQNLKDLWRWWKLPKPIEKDFSVESIIETSDLNEWNTEEQTLQLLGMMNEHNLHKVKEVQKQKKLSIGFLYKRTRNGKVQAEIRFDGIAGCLRTPSGGSSRQVVVVVENSIIKSRLLSARETARLMGVPDSFVLPSNYNEAYHAMGDGVIVPVVEWLSQHLLLPLISASNAFPLEKNHEHSAQFGISKSIRFL